MKVKIELTKEDVAEIITNHLLEKGYNVTNKEVVFNLTKVWEGYGTNEHEVHEFTGVTVEVGK